MRQITHNHDRLYFNGWTRERAYYCADGYHEQTARIYYRHPRTLDDHMGNTPSGYYFNAIWPDGTRQRVYISQVER